MALTKGHARNAAMAPLDQRLQDMARVTVNADGSPRPGVLSQSGANLLTALATMHVAVAAAEFVTSKGKADGVMIFTNDGVVNVPIPAAPASNSRIDSIWVKQEDNTTGDAASLPIFGVASGAAAPIPTAIAVPTGALKLGELRVYSGTTAANGGANTLTNTYQMTGLRGGIVPFRTKAELAAWTTAVEGQLVRVLSEANPHLNRTYEWRLGRWIASLRYARLTKGDAQSTSGVDATWTEIAWTADASPDGLWGAGTPSRIRLDQPGLWRIDTTLRAAATIYARIGLNGAHRQDTEQSGTYVSLTDLVVCTSPSTDYAAVHIAKFTGAAVALVAGYNSVRATYLG